MNKELFFDSQGQNQIGNVKHEKGDKNRVERKQKTKRGQRIAGKPPKYPKHR